jgi:hypothetical protein
LCCFSRAKRQLAQVFIAKLWNCTWGCTHPHTITYFVRTVFARGYQSQERKFCEACEWIVDLCWNTYEEFCENTENTISLQEWSKEKGKKNRGKESCLKLARLAFFGHFAVLEENVTEWIQNQNQLRNNGRFTLPKCQ